MRETLHQRIAALRKEASLNHSDPHTREMLEVITRLEDLCREALWHLSGSEHGSTHMRTDALIPELLRATEYFAPSHPATIQPPSPPEFGLIQVSPTMEVDEPEI